MFDKKKKDAEDLGMEAPSANAETSDAAPKKKKPKKKLAIISAVCVVVIAAGGGFWVWHEQPSFCNAICHSPMDPYLPTYEAEEGQAALDKWGDEVADGSYMLASVHRTDSDARCMTCHVPEISEQVTEATEWIAGNYYDPLDERSLDDLTEARGVDGDEFCLNAACHDVTREDLEAALADKYEFNPHKPRHGAQDCTACHKAHRQSVLLCTECHMEAEVPDGWLSADEGKQLAEAQGLTQKGLAGV